MIISRGTPTDTFSSDEAHFLHDVRIYQVVTLECLIVRVEDHLDGNEEGDGEDHCLRRFEVYIWFVINDLYNEKGSLCAEASEEGPKLSLDRYDLAVDYTLIKVVELA